MPSRDWAGPFEEIKAELCVQLQSGISWSKLGPLAGFPQARRGYEPRERLSEGEVAGLASATNGTLDERKRDDDY